MTQLDEPERKLAALVAADVVGFSRMVGFDEAGTLARLDAARREVIDPLLRRHRGRVFKVMGDGTLVEFPSVVLALRAAIAVQAVLRERNAALPPGHRIVLRVGVHQADVVVQGSDLLGEGVNVAARLERLSAPGGICISDRVREDAEGKIALHLRDGGEQALRNIARPVRVFHVLHPGGAAAPADVPWDAPWNAPWDAPWDAGAPMGAAHDRADPPGPSVAPEAGAASAGVADVDRTIAFAPAPACHKLVLLGDATAQAGPQAAGAGRWDGRPHGREFLLGATPAIIGRMPPSDIVLPGTGVSRAHCRIELVGGAVFATDLRSTNGTFVDDRRIGAPTLLWPGALLQVGPHVLRYVRQAGPALPEAAAVPAEAGRTDAGTAT